MSLPSVLSVTPGSPAEHAGLRAGDEIVAIGGAVPRDVIEYRWLVDAASFDMDIRRAGDDLRVRIDKQDGGALGAEISSAVFDRVRTCDNHCEFCFIHQLPKGLRQSLYLKDDDHRLSFLYGNFTTLTRFTEADLERVITEGLSPLHVSIHATDPDVRAAMLRNRRGATSLRWLRALLDEGVEVHGQVVVCPGVNDGIVLDDTLTGVADRFAELATVCVVPLGVSRFNTEPNMRPHERSEAIAVVDVVEAWQERFLQHLGRRLVFAADEYYLLAGRPFPAAESYEGFPQHENGVGMARTFEAELAGLVDEATGTASGFFSWVDGAPADGYRAPRQHAESTSVAVAFPTRRRGSAPVAAPPPVTVLTGVYGAAVLRPALDAAGHADVDVLAVENRFFGGNIGVTGLLVGEDLARTLAEAPAERRYLLPDVCLSEGRFLDGTTPADLPRRVEVIPADGVALRRALRGA